MNFSLELYLLHTSILVAVLNTAGPPLSVLVLETKAEGRKHKSSASTEAKAEKLVEMACVFLLSFI